MKLRRLIIATAVVISILFAAVGIYAASAPDMIPMNNAAYKKHKKKIVTFSHKKHNVDYKIVCGECHHDDAGKPLELKDGDDVKGCVECHKETGKLSKADKKLKKPEKIKRFHKEALHANCIGCHKKIKKGPKKSSDCHPKKKKK
jgi:hypothetical protein